MSEEEEELMSEEDDEEEADELENVGSSEAIKKDSNIRKLSLSSRTESNSSRKDSSNSFVRKVSSNSRDSNKENKEATLSEAEMAILAAKKRQEEEQEAKLLDYEERRRIEREKIEEELRALKEKQAKRRQEREEEELEFAKRRKEHEEKRRQEEEQLREKVESAKRRREEEKNKRQQSMASSFSLASGAKAGEKNFTIQKITKAETNPQTLKQINVEMNEQNKRAYMATIQPVNTTNMLPNDLKDHIKKLHAKIVRMEAEKYDLEKRNELQIYDLKELHERQRQRARQRALQRGCDPEESGDTLIPPKVTIASKFDREVDHRSYFDRRLLYEKTKAEKKPKILRGTGRPPADWGRHTNEELETIRKTLETPRYREQIKLENVAPPIPPAPLQIPDDSDDEDNDTKAANKSEESNQAERSDTKKPPVPSKLHDKNDDKKLKPNAPPKPKVYQYVTS
ncbi:unnamed protein product [Thelazia callipaeda]|uniref:Troponin T n=1 Tax=Thelazia callipaeda TaxID=103827 RepID=A0A0N5CZJ0_THECL|nr:unnamed protein product [Thelazia callipaeda]